jgi:cytochrome c-type biogenesis protein CcmH
MSSPPQAARHPGAGLPDAFGAASLRAASLALPTGLLLALAAAVAAQFAASARAAEPRAGLPAIERQVMCVTCKIPLNEAQAPQAERERAFIRRLIEEGRSEAQIKDALVGQYGSTVLALPGAHGFDVAVYAVPGAVVLALLALLAVLLPSWRRRARARAASARAPGQLSATDAARLDADIARFD